MADDGDDAVKVVIGHGSPGRGPKENIYPKVLKAEMGKEGLAGLQDASEAWRLFPLDASEDGVVLDLGFVTENDFDHLGQNIVRERMRL